MSSSYSCYTKFDWLDIFAEPIKFRVKSRIRTSASLGERSIVLGCMGGGSGCSDSVKLSEHKVYCSTNGSIKNEE